MPAFEDYFVKTTPFRDPVPPTSIPTAYEIEPMPDRPASIITHIASKRKVEAITIEDFRSAALHWPDNTTLGEYPALLGTRLGRSVLGSTNAPPRVVPEEYYALFVPKKSRQVALLCEFAPVLLENIKRGSVELSLSSNQQRLFIYTCQLLDRDNAIPFMREL